MQFKVISKYLTLLTVILVVSVFSPKTYASTIFSDPVIGSIGTLWDNPEWIYHDSLFGIYDSNGAHGHYYPWKDVASQDQIIKWTYHYGNAQDILSIRCRISYDGLNTEQVTIYPDTSPNIDEGVNGIYVGKASFTANKLGNVNGELDCIGDTLTYKENGIVKATYIMNLENTATGVAFYSSGDGNTSISNIQICSVSGCNNLSVPLIKQTDPQWGQMTYDGAQNWFPEHPTIARWGCAMTSAAMILQYYGIYKLPDGTPLDPGTLNTWLENQSDGYIDGTNSGFVNPLAITRLVKQARTINNVTSFDALEYQHDTSSDKTQQLTDDLNNNQPDVLEVPGHFIVATTVDGSTFDINDPYYQRTTLADGYDNSFISLNRYIPSHSDLSYIMLTVDPSVTVSLATSAGTLVGDQFVQQPFNDPTSPGVMGGKPIKIVYFAKPQSGAYTVTLSSTTNQQYTLGSYLYDKDGNVDKQTFPGILTSNAIQTFTIDFDSQNSSNSSTEKTVTFQSFILDVNNVTNTEELNRIFRTPLLAIIDAAQKSTEKKNKIPEKIQLEAIQAFLNIFHNRGISDIAYQTLTQDNQYLLDHL